MCRLDTPDFVVIGLFAVVIIYIIAETIQNIYAMKYGKQIGEEDEG